MTGRRVTLPLEDGSTLTITCPPWCVGHPQVPTYRADITHQGREITVEVPTNRGAVEVIAAALAQAPFSEVGSRAPYIAVRLGSAHYEFSSAAALYGLAEDITAKVRTLLRAAGDQLARAIDETGDGQ